MASLQPEVAQQSLVNQTADPYKLLDSGSDVSTLPGSKLPFSRDDQAMILRHLYGCSSNTWSYYDGKPRGWAAGRVQKLDEYISKACDINITGADGRKGGIIRNTVWGDWTKCAALDIDAHSQEHEELAAIYYDKITRKLSYLGIKYVAAISSYDRNLPKVGRWSRSDDGWRPRGFHIYVLFAKRQSASVLRQTIDNMLTDVLGKFANIDVWPAKAALRPFWVDKGNRDTIPGTLIETVYDIINVSAEPLYREFNPGVLAIPSFDLFLEDCFPENGSNLPSQVLSRHVHVDKVSWSAELRRAPQGMDPGAELAFWMLWRATELGLSQFPYSTGAILRYLAADNPERTLSTTEADAIRKKALRFLKWTPTLPAGQSRGCRKANMYPTGLYRFSDVFSETYKPGKRMKLLARRVGTLVKQGASLKDVLALEQVKFSGYLLSGGQTTLQEHLIEVEQAWNRFRKKDGS